MVLSVLRHWFTAARRSPGMVVPARRPRVFLQLESLETRTVLSTLTVLNNADHGAGSLRDTLAAAHNGDTINFANSLAGKTITLTTGELDLTRSVTIRGLGAGVLTISGNDASRVFNLAGGVTVTIADLAIVHGHSSGTLAPGMGGGGAILNQAGARLTLSRDAFSDNQAVGAVGFTVLGGALLNLGTATVLSCQFTDNQAAGGGTTTDDFGGAAGGAIDNFGNPAGAALVVADSVFSGNRAVSAGAGNYGSVGGALDSNGGLTGGNPATAVITDSTFVHNLATGGLNARPDGGAISNTAGTSMTLSGCTISDNRAVGGGGGDGVTTGDSEGVGGGILNYDSTLNVLGCAITGNLALGGNNTTISAADPYAGAGFGGGIQNNYLGVLHISDSVITGNVAQGGTTATGPGGIAVGGGISNGPTAVMTMTNCVVAGNRAIGGAGGPGVNTHLGAGQQAGFAIGGGIDVSNNASQATITDSLISGNRAIGGAGGSGNNGSNGYGGGLSAGFNTLLGTTDGSQVTLADSSVLGNLAKGGDGGAGGNGGDGLGGGLFLSASCSASVTGAVIDFNDAVGGDRGSGGQDGQGHGGGVGYQVGSEWR